MVWEGDVWEWDGVEKGMVWERRMRGKLNTGYCITGQLELTAKPGLFSINQSILF